MAGFPCANVNKTKLLFPPFYKYIILFPQKFFSNYIGTKPTLFTTLNKTFTELSLTALLKEYKNNQIDGWQAVMLKS